MRKIVQSDRNVRPGVWARVLARCRGLLGERGDALVELGVITSLLGVPLLIGTAQMGILVYYGVEVQNAAHAGAMYGMRSLTYAANTSGIQTAAQAEASDFSTHLTVASSTYYACSLALGGTQYTGGSAQTNAESGCTGGTNHALEFVQVNTSVVVTPLIHWSSLASSYTLRGGSIMEVEQ
jgi:Flp pilus assembly protein TadG